MLATLLSGILSGYFIGVGGIFYIITTAYITNEAGRLLGSILFSIGLFLICLFGLKLYTGQVSRIFIEKNIKTCLELIIMFIGNLIGAISLGIIAHFAFKSASEIHKRIMAISNAKEPSTWEDWLRMSMKGLLCGACVQHAVVSFKVFKPDLIFYVAMFVYSGFEHCIADAFYIAVGFTETTWKKCIFVLVCIITNALGTLPYVLSRSAITSAPTSSTNHVKENEMH